MPGSSVFRLVTIGCGGLPGNSAYPRFAFTLEPPPIVGEFGIFLDRYYAVIRAFTARVPARIDRADPIVRAWADHINAWVPTFPDGEAIGDEQTLAAALARIVWSVTVAHAADHYSFGQVPIGKIPLRLRVPPPASREVPPLDLAALQNRVDAFRHRMAWAMFFKDDTVTRLRDVRHRFGDPALDAAGEDFHRGLVEADTTMPVRRFIPLDVQSGCLADMPA
jgi:hypothetical protein